VDQVHRHAYLARTLALTAEGALQFTVGSEYEDLAELLVSKVDAPVAVGDGFDRDAEDEVVVLAPRAPEFFQLEGHGRLGRSGVLDVHLPVNRDDLAGAGRGGKGGDEEHDHQPEGARGENRGTMHTRSPDLAVRATDTRTGEDRRSSLGMFTRNDS